MNKYFRILLVCMAGLCSCGQAPSPAESDPDSGVSRALRTPGISVSKVADSAKEKAIPVASKITDLFIVNLNDDTLPDTLRLHSSTGDHSSYDEITVTLAGFPSRTFHTSEPWSRSEDWPTLTGKNVLSTDALFLGKGKLQSVLLLSDEISPAGYRESFSIIDIEGNEVKMVLDQNKRHLAIEAPVSLSDLDGDGRLEFVYRQIFEYDGEADSLDGKIGTYSPYFVYTVDSNCILNKPLTIKYNQEHYVFAGFKYDEKIEIFYPNDTAQHPRIWKK